MSAPKQSSRFLALCFSLSVVGLIPSALGQSSQATSPPQSPQEWIRLGEAVHGGFGSHIALGIRIGLDAMNRLGAKPRQIEAVVQEGHSAPCACVADGLMVATAASPGQRTLQVNPKSHEDHFMVSIELRHRVTQSSLVYDIPTSAMASLAQMNVGKSALERFQVVMQTPAETLFTVKEKP